MARTAKESDRFKVVDGSRAQAESHQNLSKEVVMRMARIKLSDGMAAYHCVSRIVGGQFLLDDLGKEKLRQLLWQQADFCGVEILTFRLVSNHFHVLVRVHGEARIDDVQLQERVERFYGKKALVSQLIRQSLKEFGSISKDLRV